LATPARRGTIEQVTSTPASAQRLRDLARLRRIRDRIDREYAPPLDVEALARGAHMSAGHLSRQFRLAYGESPYGYLMTRRIERAMALLRRGDLSVTDTPGVTDDERRTIAEMMAKGTYASIILATKDLDGTFERLQASDAEVVQEPTQQPYGVRDCAVRDPAGTLIRIQELR
jgi:AraC-like DNA-binding protein